MGRVAGKVALVTGGASGIGRAAALLLAREGARVLATDLQDAAGAALAAEIAAAGGEAVYLGQDVASEPAWEATVGHALARFGRLDVVVNNAGIGSPGASIAETALADWNRLLAVNLTGVFLGTKHAIRTMRGQPEGGSIVNISSILGLVGQSMSGAYSATKGGVRLLTKSAALECARDGLPIRVNSVHPGYIETPLVRSRLDAPGGERLLERIRRAQPGGALGRPEDIAAGILFLASDESRFMNGSELVIDGAATAQ